jgi:uncharacterized phiE125 gp8 family phage protein
MITAARIAAERITNRLLQTQTLKVSFPYLNADGINRIRRSPLSAIDSFETWDGAAFAAFTGYYLKQTNGFPEIHYTTLPDVHSDVPFLIQIQFQAGYSTLPEDLELALMQHVAYLYENRGDTQSIGGLYMPREAKAIYRRYRILANYA